jgi:hypothetical protein
MVRKPSLHYYIQFETAEVGLMQRMTSATERVRASLAASSDHSSTSDLALIGVTRHGPTTVCKILMGY